MMIKQQRLLSLHVKLGRQTQAGKSLDNMPVDDQSLYICSEKDILLIVTKLLQSKRISVPIMPLSDSTMHLSDYDVRDK